MKSNNKQNISLSKAPSINNPLLTTEVINGILILKSNLKEYSIIGNYICNNAIVHGYQAGLSVIDEEESNTIGGDWSKASKQAILALKELIDVSIDLANNVCIGTNLSISGRKDVEKLFCYLWESDGGLISEELLLNVFRTTMTFMAIKENRVGSISEYSMQSELLKAIHLISTGMAKGIANENMKQASAVISKVNQRFPNCPIPNQLSGTFEIVTKKGKGVFVVDFANSEPNTLACEFVYGQNVPLNMICSDIRISEVLSIKAA